jgi:hypothetical protein
MIVIARRAFKTFVFDSAAVLMTPSEVNVKKAFLSET